MSSGSHSSTVFSTFTSRPPPSPQRQLVSTDPQLQSQYPSQFQSSPTSSGSARVERRLFDSDSSLSGSSFALLNRLSDVNTARRLPPPITPSNISHALPFLPPAPPVQRSVSSGSLSSWAELREAQKEMESQNQLNQKHSAALSHSLHHSHRSHPHSVSHSQSQSRAGSASSSQSSSISNSQFSSPVPPHNGLTRSISSTDLVLSHDRSHDIARSGLRGAHSSSAVNLTSLALAAPGSPALPSIASFHLEREENPNETGTNPNASRASPSSSSPADADVLARRYSFQASIHQSPILLDSYFNEVEDRRVFEGGESSADFSVSASVSDLSQSTSLNSQSTNSNSSNDKAAPASSSSKRPSASAAASASASESNSTSQWFELKKTPRPDAYLNSLSSCSYQDLLDIVSWLRFGSRSDALRQPGSPVINKKSSGSTSHSPQKGHHRKSSHSLASFNPRLKRHSELNAKGASTPDSPLELRDHRIDELIFPNSFLGSELVDWLLTHLREWLMISDRPAAIHIAAQLIEHGFIMSIKGRQEFRDSHDYIYQFRDPPQFVLNQVSSSASASGVGLTTKTQLNALKSNCSSSQFALDVIIQAAELLAHLFAENNSLSLASLKQLKSLYRSQYQTFTVLVEQLNELDLQAMDENEHKCFWINVYNVLFMHSLVEFDQFTAAEQREPISKPVKANGIKGYKSDAASKVDVEKRLSSLRSRSAESSPVKPRIPSSQSVFASIPRPVQLSADERVVQTQRSRASNLAFQFAYHYSIAGQLFSLADIKWAILRSNLPMTSLRLVERIVQFPPKFTESDERFIHCRNSCDFLVNFALCDATRDSPRLSIFHPDRLSSQLTRAAQLFIKEFVTFEYFQCNSFVLNPVAPNPVPFVAQPSPSSSRQPVDSIEPSSFSLSLNMVSASSSPEASPQMQPSNLVSSTSNSSAANSTSTSFAARYNLNLNLNLGAAAPVSSPQLLALNSPKLPCTKLRLHMPALFYYYRCDFGNGSKSFDSICHFICNHLTYDPVEQSKMADFLAANQVEILWNQHSWEWEIKCFLERGEKQTLEEFDQQEEHA